MRCKRLIYNMGTKKEKEALFPFTGAQEKIILSVYQLFYLSGVVTEVARERWWLRVQSSLLTIHGMSNTRAYFFLRIAG
jgi:hypothetical protein